MTRTFSYALLAALSAGLIVFVYGCGGSAQHAPDAPAAPAQQPIALPGLAMPAPASLASRDRSVSYLETDLVHVGADYSSLIPPNRGSSLGNLIALYPAEFQGQLADISRTAYATYSFNLSSFDLDPVIDLSWFHAPSAPGQAYVGLANFDTDRWDWYLTTPGTQLAVPTFTHYINIVSNKLYATVLVTGVDSTILSHIRVGRHFDEMENNEAGTIDVLPKGNFTGFSGSLGSGAGYKSYDGDAEDDYLIFLHGGDQVTVTVNYANLTGSFALSLASFYGTNLAQASGPSPLELSKTIPAGTPGPCFLSLTAASGYSDYTLDVAIKHAPSARIKADVWNGNAPLTVNFDASKSADPDGTIAKYEWDWDGDGTFDQDSGTDSTVQHAYSGDGNYRATVRVTDNNGQQDTAALTVTVGALSYDEIEPNDNLALTTRLPAVPFSNYRGSIGTGNGYPGYDGGNIDYFYFYPSPGQQTDFTLTYDPLTAPSFTSAIIQGDQATATYATPVAPGIATVSVRGSAGDVLPFALAVSINTGDFSDYSIAAATGAAPRVLLKADHLTGLAAPLAVHFDASQTTDDGTIAKYQWDWNGDQIYDFDSGSVPTALHNFGTPGTYPVSVKATDNSGLSSSATVQVYAWPSVYDEVEPNDGFNGAFGHLPALPVSGYRGNLGSSQAYAGYNGDQNDLFIISDPLQVGDKITATVTSDKTTADMYLEIKSANLQDGYGSSSTDSGVETVTRTIDGSEGFPLVLVLQVGNGQITDYTLDVSKS